MTEDLKEDSWPYMFANVLQRRPILGMYMLILTDM